MSASLAGILIALGMLLGTVGGLVWRGGRRDGRVDTVLERLTDIAGDHEERIRLVEQQLAGRAAERRRR